MAESQVSPYGAGAVPPPTNLWSVDSNTVGKVWVDIHDSLTPEELAAVCQVFVASVGDPGRTEAADGATDDEYLRVANAGAFGAFAHEEDVASSSQGTGTSNRRTVISSGTSNRNENSATEEGAPCSSVYPVR